MKKITQFGLSVLLGLFAATAFSDEKTKTVNERPVAIEQMQESKAVAINPNIVNINTASAAEIQDKLVGIGAKKAQAIVDYREKNGKFVSIEQITEVSGIGKATLEKNRDRIILE